MRVLLSLLILLLATGLYSQQYKTTTMADMPEPVANNAVVEGWANDTAYVYSFGGIDSTKVFSGIHLKSWRYNTVTDVWDTIPNLPDTLGKIAAGASYVDSIIYIIGGYHVYANSNEASSGKVHRFDPITNTYLSDGADIPVPIDDHVQAVWKDSLIYVITGWSNTTNVSDVQIYDPANDTWYAGTPVPASSLYRAFGASGTIVGNYIYYHGGASTGFNFPAQNRLRMGVINPSDPTQITWSETSTPFKTYRSIAIGAPSMYPSVDWLGGSTVTYNYNGIAYNGTGGVNPRKNETIYGMGAGWGPINPLFTEAVLNLPDSLPMDLRGYAETVPQLEYFIAGGMEANQQVSKKTIMLERYVIFSIEEIEKSALKSAPNPTTGIFKIAFESSDEREILIFNSEGKEVLRSKSLNSVISIDLSNHANGIYVVKVLSSKRVFTGRIIKQ